MSLLFKGLHVQTFNYVYMDANMAQMIPNKCINLH
jgi:hypothetical protein